MLEKRCQGRHDRGCQQRPKGRFGKAAHVEDCDENAAQNLHAAVARSAFQGYKRGRDPQS